MGFGSFIPKTERVEFPGGEFAVRGLSLEDFTVLLRHHYEPAKAMFDRYVDEAAVEAAAQAFPESVEGAGNMDDVVREALEMAPGMIGDIIARAADETEHPEKARLLPMGVQIDAITKVVRLTLEAEGGLEKMLESVTKLAESLTELNAARSP